MCLGVMSSATYLDNHGVLEEARVWALVVQVPVFREILPPQGREARAQGALAVSKLCKFHHEPFIGGAVAAPLPPSP